MKNSKQLFLLTTVIVLFVLISGGLCTYAVWRYTSSKDEGGDLGVDPVNRAALPTYDSCSAIKSAFEDVYNLSGDRVFDPLAEDSMKISNVIDLGATNAPVDYSETNIQVEGVDEADIVKTDGEYIFVANQSIVSIVKGYPIEEAELVDSIEYEDRTIIEMFLESDRLVVVGHMYVDSLTSSDSSDIEIFPAYSQLTFVDIWNVEDPAHPTSDRSLEFEGLYSTSRLIDGTAYFVLNSYPDVSILEQSNDGIVPLYRDTVQNSDAVFEPLTTCTNVTHLDPIEENSFINIIGISVPDKDADIEKEVIVGSAHNVYASLESLYVVNTNYSYDRAFPLLDVFGIDTSTNQTETTSIYKFNLDELNVTFEAQTEVPGRTLNQFSMDEYNGNLRIATTEGSSATGNSRNNVFVLNPDLSQSGEIRDIAPGEEIYSARFMGERGYLVTFVKVDPFFVLDLSDPQNPTIEGELKIPGYSDYLHPYDENHIIGIGKNAVASGSGNFTWYQGIKMALFDVTDPANPVELFPIEIGNRGTDSYALNDHKAFLFDREHNLIVIPILLAEISDTTGPDPYLSDPVSQSGEFVYQGAYVYRLTVEDGFELQGRVTHYEEDAFADDYYAYYYEDNSSIKRSLYIEDYLYSVSNSTLTINQLSDLSEVERISLPVNTTEPSGGNSVDPIIDF